MAFVGTLLGMLGAFTLTWVYLMIRRYQLARRGGRARGGRPGSIGSHAAAHGRRGGGRDDRLPATSIAAYVVIIGGLALYAVLLWRRLRARCAIATTRRR